MTASDRALIERVKQEIQEHVKVGCTGCGYCMPCPKGVDIPGTFRCYNAMYSEGKTSGRRDYLQCTVMRKDPSSASQCVGCGKCETHCPQHIAIRQELKTRRESWRRRPTKWPGGALACSISGKRIPPDTLYPGDFLCMYLPLDTGVFSAYSRPEQEAAEKSRRRLHRPGCLKAPSAA